MLDFTFDRQRLFCDVQTLKTSFILKHFKLKKLTINIYQPSHLMIGFSSISNIRYKAIYYLLMSSIETNALWFPIFCQIVFTRYISLSFQSPSKSATLEFNSALTTKNQFENFSQFWGVFFSQFCSNFLEFLETFAQLYSK